MGRLLTLLRKKGADFSPLDLPGLALWLDASDLSTITHDTGAVSQWDDKSGLGNHVTQENGSLQPATGVAAINGLNALRFATDFLSIAPSAFSTATATVFGVVRFNTLTTTNYWFGGADALSVGLAYTTDASGRWRIFQGASLNSTDLASGTTSTRVWAGQFGATDVLRIDGATVASGNAGTNVIDRFVIGNSRASGTLVPVENGDIGEVIVCSSGLSASDLGGAEAYLAARWGVTLA